MKATDHEGVWRSVAISMDKEADGCVEDCLHSRVDIFRALCLFATDMADGYVIAAKTNKVYPDGFYQFKDGNLVPLHPPCEYE